MLLRDHACDEKLTIPSANTQGLQNGGIAGLWWSFFWTFIGFGLIIISLAEMASMAPTTGGQYHWVSEFAPPKYQRVLSYLTGWMSSLCWQAGNASGSFLTGNMIQALMIINNPDYPAPYWQGTLFAYSMILLLFLANTVGAKWMPLVQNTVLVFHVGFFIVVLGVMWSAPLNSAKVVFTQFTNGGNWSSIGVSLMVGQITAIYSSIGSDAAAHMSEEIKDAGLNVPNAMVWSYFLNGILAMIVLVAYLFGLTNVDDALADPTYFPFIWVFRQAVNDRGVTALTAIVFILVVIANIDYSASTARQTFAFARDKGFPFHSWIGHVNRKLHVPVNALALTAIISCLLCVINVGSDTAFNAIISLQVVALMFSYTISIACVLYRRIAHPEMLPPARWSLGRWGVPINVISLAYACFAFFWSFWPPQTPVDAETMNWGVVMFFGVAFLCAISYLLQGRRIYKGPVSTVQGREHEF